MDDMNVTIKIQDKLGREARHRAVDAGLSLSGWVSEVIAKELARTRAKKSPTLLEALGNAKLAGLELEFPRNPGTHRPVDLS